ncbi:MAG TPA: carboxypeptidase-like regulatory domain-containing protein [Terriglobales bacterium]|jgi:hypothetical protein
MLGRILLGGALAFCGLQAVALPVHIAFEWPATNSTSEPAHVHIQAIQMATSGSSNGSVPVEAEAAPSGAVLNLGEGVWQVQASASGYWSQETEVAVARQSPEVQLSLWPAASLHGEIVTAGGEPLPRALEIQLTASQAPGDKTTSPQVPVQRSQPGPSRAVLLCAIENGTWSCLGPVGQFDMRLNASGYAPHYKWGMSLKAAVSAQESTDLGRTVLRQAASVFGRAVLRDGSDPPGPCRATLRPDVERRGPGESDSESAPASEPGFSVPLTKAGYFQVAGVLPGKHALEVVCSAASGFRELRVQADGETRIDPPLRLEELAIYVAVTPQVDPTGQRWQLTVDSTAPRYRRVANKAAASADGRWVRRGLMTGSYRVTVASADGTRWLQRDFDLRAGSAPLSLLLHLASVKVAGRVLLSSQPVRARMIFFNNAGGALAILKSDDSGRFQGLLPVTPNIRETSSWTVEAHVAHPAVTQSLLNVNVPVGGEATRWLDLELPTIAVRGSVVSADGQAQRGIQVSFEDTSGIRTTTSTDDAGNFEVPDLRPGKYNAMADSPEGSSDRTPFEVTEGSESDLKLVLNPSMRVPLYVVSSDGPVANAAVQVWIKPGVPRAFARTDQNGRFELELPPGTEELGLTVGAPGYALKLTRLKVPSDNDESPDSANTITLDDSGGKLKLNLQPPGGTHDNPGTPYLVHDGAIQDARTIAGWGTDQGTGNGNVPAMVGAIEPGKYALCLVADSAQLAALWSGPLPSDHCSAGKVEQGETLTLSSR